MEHERLELAVFEDDASPVPVIMVTYRIMNRYLGMLLCAAAVAGNGIAADDRTFPPQGVPPTFADEFDGGKLDETAWTDWVASFQGRSAGFLFARDNVAVSNGCLNLTARVMRDDEKTVENLRRGFTTYATAYVRRKEKSFYGYYECRAKTMKACVCNAFWLYDPLSDQPTKKFRPGETSEEIDIFEIFGKEGTIRSPGIDHVCFETVHQLQTPYLEGICNGGAVKLPNKTKSAKVDFLPREDFHVYGFLWTEKELVWFVDGKETFRRANDVFHRPLHLVFDCEIMYNWAGEPSAADLPAVFSVDYFRYWQVQ